MRKRIVASIDSAKKLRKLSTEALAERELRRTQRAEKLKAQLRNGLSGQKLGKHVVRENDVDVQIGEELSESLRGLKVCVYKSSWVDFC